MNERPEDEGIDVDDVKMTVIRDPGPGIGLPVLVCAAIALVIVLLVGR